ncbi:glycosyltransferase [Variovorax soli]|uniref:Spore maturation protein CgeB n=1 Tax=Variovorax soli TaxID=376815 RepID=A0ABU1NDN7_9BURK|nr:glycosyltransferase [Variovorax soli]MDR6536573.1 spore maturation protein CgeB [Variovorax soli]
MNTPRIPRLRIVILGLSITSSWGNGHATTYRALVRALAQRGHEVLFLERDMPWYAQNRDLPQPPFGRTVLYDDLDALRRTHAQAVGDADLVIVGSFVPEGAAVGDWVLAQASGLKAFYDIDTPVTLGLLRRDEAPYLKARQIAAYDLYLSFTGGPTLRRLEREFGSPAARVLYCSVDPLAYFPEAGERDLDLGYMGTYSADRQPTVERLLAEPARRWPAGRFAVAGPQYPPGLAWPANVLPIAHLPPHAHRAFYNRQRFTLNVTRADMIEAGWSPSVRLFEAAACATPIVSDCWAGIDTLLTPGSELFLVERAEEVLDLLRGLPEARRREVGERARARILAQHTSAHRAAELEAHVHALRSASTSREAVGSAS